MSCGTQVKIVVVVGDASTEQEFVLSKKVPPQHESPVAGKAVRAAAKALGVTIPKLRILK